MPEEYQDLNPPSIPFNELEPYSPEWEERMDNFNERNIISIDESEDGCEVCITYAIDTPDEFPELPELPDTIDISIPRRRRRGNRKPPIDFGIPELPTPENIIKDEFEKRFGGGSYTVCLRKRNCPDNQPQQGPPLPIDNTAPFVEVPGLPPDLPPQNLFCPSDQWIRFNFTGTYYYAGLTHPTIRHAPSSQPFSYTQPNINNYFLAWNPTEMRRVTIRVERTNHRGTCIDFDSGWQVKAVAVYDPILRRTTYPDLDGWIQTPASSYGERGGFSACAGKVGTQGTFQQTMISGWIAEIVAPCPSDDNNDENKNKPPINQVEKEMNCCEEILKRLTRIEEKIERMEKWVGSDKGGMLVPEHLQDNSPGSNWLSNAWDAITPDKKRQIKSIPEFFQWYVEKFQETFGILPLIVKDETDAELGFPTFKHAIEGVINKLAKQDKALGILQLALAKTLVELAITRQSVILGNSYGDAICTFLEMNLEEELVDIAHQLTIPSDLDIAPEDVDTDAEMIDLLKSSAFKAKQFKFDPRKKLANGKTPNTFGTTAFTVQQMWEAYQTQNGVGINKENIHNGLRDALNAIRLFSKGKDLLGKPIADRGAPGWENDLSLWANEVERAFGSIDNPPQGSAEQPWGNNSDERPKIVIRGNPATEGNDI